MSFPKVNPAEVEEAHRRLARYVAAEEGTCQACHQLTSSCYCDGPAAMIDLDAIESGAWSGGEYRGGWFSLEGACRWFVGANIREFLPPRMAAVPAGFHEVAAQQVAAAVRGGEFETLDDLAAAMLTVGPIEEW